MNNSPIIFERIKELNKRFENIAKELQANQEVFKMPSEIKDSLSKIGKGLIRVYTETPDNLLNISKFGWFLDLDCEMKYSFELNDLIENDKYDEAEKSLVNYYSNNLTEIFEVLSKRHPIRKEILSQIEKSYNEELFYLTIPVVLSQIDGICNDITTKKFFIKNKEYLPEVYPIIEKMHSSMTDIFLAPIKNSSPLNVWEKKIGDFPLKLNRHEILHGVDINYGNKINSLKCISLLKYISDLIIRIDR
ncbi:hypothetical protein SAMN06265371_106184 [Lutibacter agarilyticus]|uniref:Uncharacterized protein n=2 Tax=Lutibacter agarilyticus TaxID=1109740 RepID=A0A238XNY9_9FLAO|nr:hypothetical protein SAMN06265371_106184 [Lutibacter agarilyticus]